MAPKAREGVQVQVRVDERAVNACGAVSLAPSVRNAHHKFEPCVVQLITYLACHYLYCFYYAVHCI
jgi:hypothetical protein